MSRSKSATRLADDLGIPRARAAEAFLKAKLLDAIVAEVARSDMTHRDLATRSGIPRSAITGILTGSLQSVSLGRVLRLLDAAGLEADVRVRRAA